MNFNDYQRECRKTAIYPNQGSNITYPTLGLVGEAGEVAEKVKKLMRDHDSILTDDYREKIVKELGDVLWYASALADELRVSLDHVAEVNLAKLKARQEQNKLNGEGSDR